LRSNPLPLGALTALSPLDGRYEGKTSALRIALGLLHPQRGTVSVDGFDARRHPREARARMGGLIEVAGFYGELGGRSNLRLLARLRGLTRRDAAREADRVLELVGLRAQAAKHVHAYSQGMRQRLGIAQALLGRPRYVLLDEPTNGLDPEGIHDLRQLLRRLANETGVTILLSSHLLDEVAGLCTRIGVLHRGRMLVEAPTAELLGEDHPSFHLDTDDNAAAAELLADRPGVSVAKTDDGLLSVTVDW